MNTSLEQVVSVGRLAHSRRRVKSRGTSGFSKMLRDSRSLDSGEARELDRKPFESMNRRGSLHKKSGLEEAKLLREFLEAFESMEHDKHHIKSWYIKMRSGETLDRDEVLLLQEKLYAYSERVEILTKLVGQLTSGVKQVMTKNR